MKIIFVLILTILISQSSICQTLHKGDSASRVTGINILFDQNLFAAAKSPTQYLKEQNQLTGFSGYRNSTPKISYNIDSYLTQLKYVQTVHMMLQHLNPLASERMLRTQSDFPVPYSSAPLRN